MGRKPSNNYSLDRINNDGNYEPTNCKWSDRKEQQNNKRTTRFITYENKTLSIAQWAERLGIRSDTLKWRLDKNWPTKKAFFKPIRIKRRNYVTSHISDTRRIN